MTLALIDINYHEHFYPDLANLTPEQVSLRALLRPNTVAGFMQVK